MLTQAARRGKSKMYPQTTMNSFPSPTDLDGLGTRYSVPSAALEDLAARRRAGAHDGELINLLVQPDWGGLSRERAEQLVSELPR